LFVRPSSLTKRKKTTTFQLVKPLRERKRDCPLDGTARGKCPANGRRAKKRNQDLLTQDFNESKEAKAILELIESFNRSKKPSQSLDKRNSNAMTGEGDRVSFHESITREGRRGRLERPRGSRRGRDAIYWEERSRVARRVRRGSEKARGRDRLQ